MKWLNRMRAERADQQGAILSADAFNPDATAVKSGVAIRGIEYADDDRTAGSAMRVERLDRTELELCYRRSALMFKGINAKARDAFKAGFELVPDEDTPEARKALNARARVWMREHKFRPKVERAIREGYWSGDGFLELVYPGPSEKEAPAGQDPASVRSVDPFTIRPVIDHRRDSHTRGEIIAYWHGDTRIRDVPIAQVRKWVEGGERPREVRAVLHPSRLAHFQPYPIRGDPDGLGMSVIEAAYINVLSKTAGDRALGDILEWAGQGFFLLNIDYATEEELKKAMKMVEASKQARKTYFVGSERTKAEFAEPVIPNVDPFYKQFYVEFAAALEMPTMILMGVQKGTVSGSSVDIVQYYDDVRAFQESHVEPILHPVLARVLNTNAFSIKWTPLFVDKQTVADLTFKMSQSAAALTGAQLLTKRQAIVFLREALPDAVFPDPDEVPDEYVEKEGPSMVSGSPGGGAPGAAGAEEREDE